MAFAFPGRSGAFLALASLLAAALPASLAAQSTPPPTQQSAAPLAALVDDFQLRYDVFTLDNGLTTIVHTDRKAPIVGVTVYYRVGSKHEARGRTGFAHLFEHLMFGGSENLPDFDETLEAAGSTPTNGTTWYDRTNYVVTVPTGALDLALFAESDRMGHFLGAVTQEKLDAQRGVVQNEKREGDNEPYGLVDYAMMEGLLPVGHPYRHDTIGSMADLEAASLADVHRWFADNYGPNNVVIVLSGDIDTATARRKVQRWFGAIGRGPQVAPVTAGPVTLAAPTARVITDDVPNTMIHRAWTGPEITHPDAVPLAVGMHILGGLTTSRLDDGLVRGRELALSVGGYAQQFEQLSLLQLTVTMREGADRDAALAAIDEEVARILGKGPTSAELARAQTQFVTSAIGALEEVGGLSGKGLILAEGMLYTGDPDYFRQRLRRIAALTPAEVQAALRTWLSRPAHTLSVVPGQRILDGATMGGWGDEASAAAREQAARQAAPARLVQPGAARAAPPVAPVDALVFPQVERAQLSNGMAVVLARRTGVPSVSLALELLGGSAVDAPGDTGLHQTMIEAMSQGTRTRYAEQIALELEELGASFQAINGGEGDLVSLTSVRYNLVPAIALMADIVREPAFAPDSVAYVIEQRLSAIASEEAEPAGLALRTSLPLIYGADHPYARAATSGDAGVVAKLEAKRLYREHRKWVRPDLARITAVGDVTMAELLAALEPSFGNWAAPAAPPPVVATSAPAPPPVARLVVVDRRNSPSSFILMSRATDLAGFGPETTTVELANEVIGNGFLSRLNEKLREEKGWSYGIYSDIPGAAGQRRFEIETQVQPDRTADSIALILAELAAFPTTRPVEPAELERVIGGNIRGLPHRFETNSSVLGALVSNQFYGREDRYHARLPEIYRSVDAAAINAAASRHLHADSITIVVVGDRTVIEPQLVAAGMQAEFISAPEQ